MNLKGNLQIQTPCLIVNNMYAKCTIRMKKNNIINTIFTLPIRLIARRLNIATMLAKEKGKQ